MRTVLGPGVLRHVDGINHVTEVPFDSMVIEHEPMDGMGEAIATLSAHTLTTTASLTAFGRMWLAGLLGDDWRRYWYRAPGGWWEA